MQGVCYSTGWQLKYFYMELTMCTCVYPKKASKKEGGSQNTTIANRSYLAGNLEFFSDCLPWLLHFAMNYVNG